MAPDWPRESHEVILINIEQDWNSPCFCTRLAIKFEIISLKYCYEYS